MGDTGPAGRVKKSSRDTGISPPGGQPDDSITRGPSGAGRDSERVTEWCRERRHPSRLRAAAVMLLRGLNVPAAEFEAGTGWQIRPEGACRGEVCIPLRGPAGDNIDIVDVAERMGLPLVQDDRHEVWALGPWPGGGRALVSAEAPELVLPDLDRNEFRLSSLRGQKVLILSWAPY